MKSLYEALSVLSSIIQAPGISLAALKRSIVSLESDDHGPTADFAVVVPLSR